MVRQVAGDEERERPHGDVIAVCDAAPCPPARRHVPEQRNRRQSYTTKLLDVRRPGCAIGLGSHSSNFLIETVERALKSAREPERAKGKRSLGVGYVIQHLANAPFSRCIAIERLLFGDRREEVHVLRKLVLDDRDGIVACYVVDVREGIGGCFVVARASNHPAIL